MKLLANLILTASVIFGALAATTAYLAPLSLPDEDLIGLTLNADAGLLPATPTAPNAKSKSKPKRKPVAKKNTVLTGPILADLRANTFTAQGAPRTVKYVTVKEFSLGRWVGKWVFLASLGGLLLGAFMIRSATKRAIGSASEDTAGMAESPEATLREIIEVVASLRRDLPAMADDQARLHAILDRVGAAQRDPIAAFIDARATLVNRLGLGGYAELMDRFAAAERQINRAWSAAADRALAESTAALDAAADMLEEAKAKLG